MEEGGLFGGRGGYREREGAGSQAAFCVPNACMKLRGLTDRSLHGIDGGRFP